MRHLVLALALLPVPAIADPPPPFGAPSLALGPTLTGSEFDAYVTGKTLSYGQYGQVWGTEQYMPGQQVLWAFEGAPCEYGQWYEDHGAICFIYEGNPNTSCWYFYKGSQGLVAQFLGASSQISEVANSPEPMNCPGPQVGT